MSRAASRKRPTPGRAARKPAPPRLPGDLAPEARIARMLRVNQAGEYGAKRIYDGQLAVLGGRRSGAVIAEMAEQEQAHLDAFNRLLVERRVRPTALAPLWHAAGFLLGAGTALMGERAAMACTVAVEEVIDGHYRRQTEALGESEGELKRLIETFRADELHHRDVALAHRADTAPGYQLLRQGIKTGTRLAIWLSERV